MKAISNTSPLLYLYRLEEKGMWLSDDIRRRILSLSGEIAENKKSS